MALSYNQQRFVNELLADPNRVAGAAYRRAYPGCKSEASANSAAQRLLKNVEIKQFIANADAKRMKRVELNHDYVISNLTEIVERCMQRAPVCNNRGVQIQDEEGRDVWTFNARGAVASINLLGKHLGMFQDKGTLNVKVSGRVGLSIDDLRKLPPDELARIYRDRLGDS